MKDFKVSTFLSAFLVIALIAILSGMCAWTFDEGGSKSGFVGMFFYFVSKLFWIAVFPFALLFLTVFRDTANDIYWPMIFWIAIDCMIYALLTERFLYWRRKRKLNKNPS